MMRRAARTAGVVAIRQADDLISERSDVLDAALAQL
jgi:hypothetical protein